MAVDRSLTEATGKELINSISELNTSMAVANTRLQDIAIKFDRQEQLNSDIERRMKEREIDAERTLAHINNVESASERRDIKQESRLDTIEAWKKAMNGVFIAVGTAIGITVVLGILYIVFGAKP